MWAMCVPVKSPIVDGVNITVILEIFAVVNNSRWKETAKIKHSNVQRMYRNS